MTTFKTEAQAARAAASLERTLQARGLPVRTGVSYNAASGRYGVAIFAVLPLPEGGAEVHVYDASDPMALVRVIEALGLAGPGAAASG